MWLLSARPVAKARKTDKYFSFVDVISKWKKWCSPPIPRFCGSILEILRTNFRLQLIGIQNRNNSIVSHSGSANNSSRESLLFQIRQSHTTDFSSFPSDARGWKMLKLKYCKVKTCCWQLCHQPSNEWWPVPVQWVASPASLSLGPVRSDRGEDDAHQSSDMSYVDISSWLHTASCPSLNSPAAQCVCVCVWHFRNLNSILIIHAHIFKQSLSRSFSADLSWLSSQLFYINLSEPKIHQPHFQHFPFWNHLKFISFLISSFLVFLIYYITIRALTWHFWRGCFALIEKYL